VRHLLAATVLTLIASPLAGQSDQSIQAAVASITPEEIIRRIGVIAHDSMRGRATPSPGLEKTGGFIAAEFRRFRLRPGGDSGGFIQRYGLMRTELDTVNSMIAIGGAPPLRFPGDAVSGTGSREVHATGRAVLLSGGTLDPGSRQQLKLGGTVVLIPLAPEDPAGRNHPLVGALGALSSLNPAAIIYLTPLGDAQWQQRTAPARNPQLTPAWHSAPQGALVAPVLLVRNAAVRTALARAGIDLGARPPAAGPVRATPLDLTVSVTVKQRSVSAASAPNVVGILEGSDSVLRREYLVFSGHMDHVGVGTPDATGDSIYNGADDDASGTIAVVQLAEAFSRLRPRPKRSMIFLAVSGEERGLWGSEYFALNPGAPVTQMVANLNIDMVGRNWRDTIVAIGKEHSDLGATLNRVNTAHPELGMTAIDDLWPEEDFYRRSDHFNFAARGVPVLFFFNGTHEDYHRPGDEVSKIDGEKQSRIVKLLFYLGLEIANSAARPRWNPQSYREIVRPAP